MIQRITVTISEADVERCAAIAEQLAAAGMTVERVLPALAMVTGTIASERRATLEAIDGVAAVTAEQVYQLPDPGSGLQ